MDAEIVFFVILGLGGLYILLSGSNSSPIAAPNAQIGNLGNAIANAEGSGATNNPGDLTSGDASGFNVTGVFNSAGVVNFATPEDGWGALYAKLQRIQNGDSQVYSLNDTISQFAYTWTGGDNADGWAADVAQHLGVSIDTQLSDPAVLGG